MSIAICKKIEAGYATRLWLLSPFLERPSALNLLGHIAICCLVLPPQHTYSEFQQDCLNLLEIHYRLPEIFINATSVEIQRWALYKGALAAASSDGVV
jgi:hypothetical protein